MKHIITIASVILLTACGSVRPYHPTVDHAISAPSGRSIAQDKKECHAMAVSVSGIGSNLVWDMLSGNKRGMEKKQEKFESVYQKCMSGRGWGVVG